MNKIICPMCGSENLKEIFEIQEISDSNAEKKFINIRNYKCMACDYEGDIQNENEDIIESALENIKKESIINILNELQKLHISLSAIERILSIPQRTLTKWKSGVTTPSAASIALLKYINIYPWLLNVAENGYEYNMAQRIHVQDAMNQFIQNMNFSKSRLSEAGVVTNPENSIVYFKFDNDQYDETQVRTMNSQSIEFKENMI